MALELQVPTSHRIDATYWRIENIDIDPVVRRITITVNGHKNWEQAGGPTTRDKDRPEKIAAPLRSFTFTRTGQDYVDLVESIAGSDPQTEAYRVVKEIGTPDSGAAVDFSEAEDMTIVDALFAVSTDGLGADFTDESTTTYGHIETWTWDFGDGTTETIDATAEGYAEGDENVRHTYESGGDYTATLEVTDSHGYVHSLKKQVAVSA